MVAPGDAGAPVGAGRGAPVTSENVARIWNANAAFWDQRMGHEGNDYQRLLVGPAQERLLGLKPGETVLDVACGNGVFSRRMADLGCQVVACDVAPRMIELARARSGAYAGRIEYLVCDATDEQALLALGEGRFDAAVCSMAMMDMPEIRPLLSALARLIKPDGRVAFSVVHPCFNLNAAARVTERSAEGNRVVDRHFLKVPASYITPSTAMGIATAGQPELQYYFDRPLSLLLGTCFEAGFVVDGLEEPVFPPEDGEHGLWTQIPPILAVRLRLAEPRA